MLPGELEQSAVVPLVQSAAKLWRAIAVDGAPGDGIGAPAAVSLGKPSVTAADPEIMASGRHACGHVAGEAGSPRELAEDAGVGLWPGHNEPCRARCLDPLSDLCDGVQKAPRRCCRPLSSGKDAGFGQASRAEGSGHEGGEGELRCDAVADLAAGGKLRACGAVATKDSGIKAELTLRVHGRGIAEDRTVVRRSCRSAQQECGGECKADFHRTLLVIATNRAHPRVCRSAARERSDTQNGGRHDQQPGWRVLTRQPLAIALKGGEPMGRRIDDGLNYERQSRWRGRNRRGQLAEVVADLRTTTTLRRHIAALSVHGAATGALA